MIYVLVVLGTYLVSSFDLLYHAVPHIAEAHVTAVRASGASLVRHPIEKSKSLPKEFQTVHHDEDERMGPAVKNLLRSWQKCEQPSEVASRTSSHNAKNALRKCLQSAVERSVIERDAIIDL